MPTGDLKPGDVTTLGALRPGDVGEFSNNPDGGKFVVTDVLPSESLTWIQYQHDTKPHARYSEQVVGGGWKVCYLGTGRIEPARIVMRDEPDPLSALRELEDWKAGQLKVESEWDAQEVARLLKVPLGQSIRAAIQPGIEKLQQRVAELEGHVGELREELRYAIEIAVQRSDPPLPEQVFKDAHALLAATAPKGQK